MATVLHQTKLKLEYNEKVNYCIDDRSRNW